MSTGEKDEGGERFRDLSFSNLAFKIMFFFPKVCLQVNASGIQCIAMYWMLALSFSFSFQSLYIDVPNMKQEKLDNV